MHHIIHKYESIMIDKVLSCKTPLEVLNIIDKKIGLIQKKTNDKSTVSHFIYNSLSNLRKVNQANIYPDRFSKIRTAIDHLQNIQRNNK